MSAFGEKLVQVLEVRFGVEPQFARQLVPVLERVAERRPGADDWERLLGCVAAAYHARVPDELDQIDEVQVLVGQFISELKKMDESLKVLGAYLDRLRRQVTEPRPPRLLH